MGKKTNGFDDHNKFEYYDVNFKQSDPEEESVFKQSENKDVYKQSENNTLGNNEIEIVYKLNKKKELKINTNFYIFNGKESKIVSSDILKHPDFLSQEKYFIIKRGGK